MPEGQQTRFVSAGEALHTFDDTGLLIYERVLPAFADSVPRIRRELAETLVLHDLATQRRADIALVVSEAATNAVVHAYRDMPPGPLYAAAALGPDALTIWISDFGCGMIPDPDNAGLGLGLALMGRLSDQLQIGPEADAPGTCITARFAAIRQPAASHAPRRHAPTPGSDRRAMLIDYLHAVRAASTALREDTEAVLAQADLAVAHARRQRARRVQRP